MVMAPGTPVPSLVLEKAAAVGEGGAQRGCAAVAPPRMEQAEPGGPPQTLPAVRPMTAAGEGAPPAMTSAAAAAGGLQAVLRPIWDRLHNLEGALGHVHPDFVERAVTRCENLVARSDW